MENFKSIFSPEELADELISLSHNLDDKDKRKLYIDFLSWLQAAAQNPYNHSYFAEFYKLLENIANW